MKSFVLMLLFVSNVLSMKAQILNSNFEDWVIVDDIENPANWETNNFYVGYTPAKKINDAIEGNYSLKISSTGKDIYGERSMRGCAHLKLLPVEMYQSMRASVRIDSIDRGRIEFRVKQRTPNGLYEKIGAWVGYEKTNGIIDIAFPIEMFSMDSLLIEILAFNKDHQLGYVGYSGATIDNLELSTALSGKSVNMQEQHMVTVYPNPAHDVMYVRLAQKTTSARHILKVKNSQGVVLYTAYQAFGVAHEMKLSLSGYMPGIYFVEVISESFGSVAKRFVVL